MGRLAACGMNDKTIIAEREGYSHAVTLDSSASAFRSANERVRCSSTTAVSTIKVEPPSLVEWLLLRRISPEDSGRYAAALIALGFDDILALQEDATQDDLQQAGMKTGHIRRTLKALHKQRPQQRQQRYNSSPSREQTKGPQHHHQEYRQNGTAIANVASTASCTSETHIGNVLKAIGDKNSVNVLPSGIGGLKIGSGAAAVNNPDGRVSLPACDTFVPTCERRGESQDCYFVGREPLVLCGTARTGDFDDFNGSHGQGDGRAKTAAAAVSSTATTRERTTAITQAITPNMGASATAPSPVLPAGRVRDANNLLAEHSCDSVDVGDINEVKEEWNAEDDEEQERRGHGRGQQYSLSWPACTPLSGAPFLFTSKSATDRGPSAPPDEEDMELPPQCGSKLALSRSMSCSGSRPEAPRMTKLRRFRSNSLQESNPQRPRAGKSHRCASGNGGINGGPRADTVAGNGRWNDSGSSRGGTELSTPNSTCASPGSVVEDIEKHSGSLSECSDPMPVVRPAHRPKHVGIASSPAVDFACCDRANRCQQHFLIHQRQQPRDRRAIRSKVDAHGAWGGNVLETFQNQSLHLRTFSAEEREPHPRSQQPEPARRHEQQQLVSMPVLTSAAEHNRPQTTLFTSFSTTSGTVGTVADRASTASMGASYGMQMVRAVSDSAQSACACYPSKSVSAKTGLATNRRHRKHFAGGGTTTAPEAHHAILDFNAMVGRRSTRKESAESGVWDGKGKETGMQAPSTPSTCLTSSDMLNRSSQLGDAVSDGLGRGGHVKTLQRIRSTGRPNGDPQTSQARAPSHGGSSDTRDTGGSVNLWTDHGTAGEGQEGPNFIDTNQGRTATALAATLPGVGPGQGPAAMAMAMAAGGGAQHGRGAADILRNIRRRRHKSMDDSFNIPVSSVLSETDRGSKSFVAGYSAPREMPAATAIAKSAPSSHATGGGADATELLKPKTPSGSCVLNRVETGAGGGGRGDATSAASGSIGLSLDLNIIPGQAFETEQSCDFSEGGTLRVDGFVLKPDGIEYSPTTATQGMSSGGELISKVSGDDRILRGRHHPPALQTPLVSTGFPPSSRDSSVETGGGGLSVCGGSGGGAPATASCVLAIPPPPPLTTTTPRRTRETTILLEEIGRGGGGTVYKAIHVPSMRLVAVKIVEVNDDEKRKQMIKELRALHSMNRVPLTSPGPPSGDHSTGAIALGGWEEWSNGSLGSNSSSVNGGGGGGGGGRDGDGEGGNCEWRKEDSSKREIVHGRSDSSGDCTCSLDGGGSTRTTVAISPASQGRTLSSRDDTPCTNSMHQHACAGYGGLLQAGAGGNGKRGTNMQDNHNQRSSFGLLDRPVSTCGFAARDTDKEGSGDGGGDGDDGGVRDGGDEAGARAHGIQMRRVERRQWHEDKRRQVRQDSPVVAFHDAYTDVERGRVCLVMEYMNGGTLEQFVSRREALPEAALAAVARPVLRGLASMHSNHQIHRDIKPSNILVDRAGRVKIADFGVVREFNRTGSLAKTFTGTLTYMSPERIKDSNYSYPSDVWSLGMVIAALALGEFPLSMGRGHYFDMLQAITMDPVPTLSPQSFSAELCDFVNLMLQREPSDRATAASLLEHSFLETHQDTHRLVDMITVAPATSDEVRTILTKIVEYHSAASHIEGEKVESTVSFFGREKSGGGGYSGGGGGRDRWSPRYTSPPPLRKADVAVLAAQLQVTRTELVEEYEQIRKRAERELWGDAGIPQSCRAWRRGHSFAPNTPGFVHRGRVGDRIRVVSSSPYCADTSLNVSSSPSTRHAAACETPQIGGSAASDANSRK